MRFVLCLLFVLSVVGPGLASDADWQVLFNGKDFDGWVIDGPKEYKDKADGNKVKPLWAV